MVFPSARLQMNELKMQSANAERAARAVWVMCVVVPLVCVAMCGTISPFVIAGIFLIVTTAQALKTAPFSRTSTLEEVSYSVHGSFYVNTKNSQ